MSKLRLIGFAGRKRSGKTSLSKIMERHYNAVTITAANYLKQLCAELLSITLDELNVRKDDGTTFSKRSNEEWSKVISNATGISVNDINETIGGVEFTTVRQLLQVIGTDLIRKYKPNWHCIIGKNFQVSFSHEENAFISIKIGRITIVLFKIG